MQSMVSIVKMLKHTQSLNCKFLRKKINMSTWQVSPFKMEVNENQTLAFCSCGFSDYVPFCDRTHNALKNKKDSLAVNDEMG